MVKKVKFRSASQRHASRIAGAKRRIKARTKRR